MDTAEYDELLALATLTTFDFVAGQYTLATESMEFHTIDFVTKLEHVQLVETKTNARPYWRQSRIRRVRRCRRSTKSNVSNSTLSLVCTGHKETSAGYSSGN